MRKPKVKKLDGCILVFYNSKMSELGISVCVAGIIIFLISNLLGNNRNDKLNYSAQSFAWGYTCGYLFTIIGVINILLSLYILIRQWLDIPCEVDPSLFVFLLIISPFSVVLGYYTLRKNRWAFVGATIASLNPLFYAINLVYILRRWKDMGGEFGIRGAFDWLIKLSNNFSDWISGTGLVARFRMKRNDECYYEQVAEELKNEFKKEGLWLKALKKCGGNLIIERRASPLF